LARKRARTAKAVGALFCIRVKTVRHKGGMRFFGGVPKISAKAGKELKNMRFCKKNEEKLLTFYSLCDKI
jgi:hypothetical protein